MTCAVLVPDGKIAMGKLSQAVAHGATLIQVEGNFDDCLTVARKLAEAYPVELVNSVNPARIEGQKTAAFEVVDALGDAPDIHVLPVGNAGNITAYWRGYTRVRDCDTGTRRRAARPVATRTPQMWGFQAAGAAPIVLGHPVDDPETIATAIRIGNPASWRQAEAARDESGGRIEAVTDDEILAGAPPAVRPPRASSSSPARPRASPACSRRTARVTCPRDATVVCTVTGHGLKDPQWALRTHDGVRDPAGAGAGRRLQRRGGPRPRGVT